MAALQGQAREANILVLDAGSAPIAGLVFGDFVVRFKKPGETVFGPKTLAAATDLEEISDGWYIIRWSGTEMNTLGAFLFEVASSGGTPVPVFYGEFDVEPNTVAALAVAETCVITGNVVDIGGQVGLNTRITFNPVTGPITSGDSFVRSTMLKACRSKPR